MRKFYRLLTMSVLTALSSLVAACGDKPPVVISSVDTLCVVTTRPPISEVNRNAFKSDQTAWEPLVNWLAGFIKERDKRCLQPQPYP